MRRAGVSRGSAEDDRLEQLERLGRLKQSGVIDQEEFTTQKQLILAGPPEPEVDAPRDAGG